jgi:Glutaminase
MSVAKPFVFALVCQALGPEEARDRLGANATGLPFNSLAACGRPATATSACPSDFWPGAVGSLSTVMAPLLAGGEHRGVLVRLHGSLLVRPGPSLGGRD